LKLKVLILLLSVSLSIYSQNKGQTIQSVVNDYRTRLINYMRDDTVASLSFAILIDGKIVVSDAIGYADYQNKIKADSNTIYRIGSITKPITAFLMMQMAEKGYFKLDDKVEDYLPEVKRLIGYSDSTKITFKQLATHYSGLPFNPDLENAALGPIEHWEEKVIEGLAVTSFQYKPDETYSYSNYGYGILGLAISRAVGRSFTELVQENIFSPLQMDNTSFVMPSNKLNHLAVGTMKKGFENCIDIYLLEQKGRGYKVPVGGIYSTPCDYAKFMQAIMGLSKTSILSDKSREMMLSIGIGYGHKGSNYGYTTAFAIDRKLKNGVILMRNYFPEYEYQNFTKDFVDHLSRAENN
jgi:CubicO group peptidase (beta-lactamase class C family)